MIFASVWEFYSQQTNLISVESQWRKTATIVYHNDFSKDYDGLIEQRPMPPFQTAHLESAIFITSYDITLSNTRFKDEKL